MRKKTVLIIFICLFIVGFYMYLVYQTEQNNIEAYDAAVFEILEENYTSAKVKLEPLAQLQYKDSEELFSFCEGMEYYLLGGDSLSDAKTHVEKCTFREQKDLYKDIFLERKQLVLDAKTAYDLEQKRIREEQERLRLEREAEKERKAHEAFLRKIHEGVPYVGMPQAYIDDTSLGKHSDSYTNTIIENNKKVKGTGYFWKKNGYQIFFAFCRYGKVVDVADQRNSIEAQKQRKAENKKAAQTKKTSSEDPYNAKDYGYASDFYEDHYDEFYDAIDAEDYWEEHYYE